MTESHSWKDYTDFVLKIERQEEGQYRVEAQSSVGEATTSFELPFDEKDLKIFLLEVGRPRQSASRGRVPEPMEKTVDFGEKLFNAIINGPVRDVFITARLDTEERDTGLRIRLRLSDAPELADLPWEYLYDGRDFLALSSDTPLVRYLDLPNPPRAVKVDLPLRILVTISAPHDQLQIDVAQEEVKIRESLGNLMKRKRIELDFTPDATLKTLQRQMRRAKSEGRPYHVWHYIGHGVYDPVAQGSVLMFTDDDQMSYKVNGFQLGTLFNNYPETRLALLNACEGARVDREDPFSGVAAALVERGVPAVIGMQWEISDQAAIAFSSEFYAALVDGLPIDAALTEARRAVFFLPNWIEWATPVLFMRSRDGALFDVQPSKAAEEPATGPLQELFAQANDAFWTEDWDKALDLFQQIVDQDPEFEDSAEKLRQARSKSHSESLYKQAVEAENAGDWDQALIHLETLLAAAPDYKDAPRRLEVARQKKKLADLVAKAQEYHAQAKWDAVLNVFAEISEVDPGFVDTDNLLASARAQIQTSDTTEAARLAREQAQAEKAVEDKAAIERLAREQAEVQRLATEQALANQRALEQAQSAGIEAEPGQALGWLRSLPAIWIAGGGVLIMAVIAVIAIAVLSNPPDDGPVTPPPATSLAVQPVASPILPTEPAVVVVPTDAQAGLTAAVATQPAATLAPTSTTAPPTRVPRTQIGLVNAAQLRQVGLLGRGTITPIRLSPDGQRLAVAGGVGVWVYDLSDPKSPQFLAGHSDWVRALAWSPDGSRLASAGDDQTVRIWDANTLSVLRTLTGHTSRVRSVSWSPDNSQLASGGNDGQVIVWDANSNSPVAKINSGASVVWSVAWSPTGSQIAWGGTNGVLRLRAWGGSSFGTERSLAGHTGDVSSVFWSQDGDQLASRGGDGKVRIWDAASGVQVGELNASGDWLNSLGWESARTLLSSEFADGRVPVTDAATGRELIVLEGFSDWINSLAWDPRSEWLAGGTLDGTIRVWNPDNEEQLAVLAGHGASVNAVAVSPDGSRLASAGSNGSLGLGLWDTDGWQSLGLQPSPSYAVAWSPDGSQLATAGDSGALAFWDADGSLLFELTESHTQRINVIAWSPDGRLLATGSAGGTVFLWNVSSRSIQTTLSGNRGEVTSLAWSPDSRSLATGSKDKHWRIFNISSGSITRFADLNEDVESVAWSPDGTMLAVGTNDGNDGSVRVYDSASGNLLVRLSGHHSAVGSLAWSPDRTLLASGSREGAVRLWGLP